MMLPILISVSLAPGSYFFCASAADAEKRIAVATMLSPTKRVARSGIALSRGSLLIATIVAAQRDPRKRPNILPRGTGVVARRQV
jgi:hypothetical protein